MQARDYRLYLDDMLEATCRKLLEAGPLAGDESLAET
jgi:hypothetical protein